MYLASICSWLCQILKTYIRRRIGIVFVIDKTVVKSLVRSRFHQITTCIMLYCDFFQIVCLCGFMMFDWYLLSKKCCIMVFVWFYDDCDVCRRRKMLYYVFCVVLCLCDIIGGKHISFDRLMCLCGFMMFVWCYDFFWHHRLKLSFTSLICACLTGFIMFVWFYDVCVGLWCLCVVHDVGNIVCLFVTFFIPHTRNVTHISIVDTSTNDLFSKCAW